ncbi:hypothetical protein MRB53_028907 [Persea americana]|uniref:Uncharacterized protein n=1 Tax=Persea americana TaxID=3435 RepID=A0ACC2KH21_PERAE|nr:hypothetical protein MRB53_028907 [Persea americana]
MCGVYYSGELLTRHGHFLSRRKFLYLNNLLVVLYWNLGAESADRGVERRIAREQILSFWAPILAIVLLFLFNKISEELPHHCYNRH